MASSTGVRLTLKFNYAQLLRGSGWSESYDLGFGSLAVANQSVANIDQFILDRCFCLGIGAYLASASISAYVQPLHPGDQPVRRVSLALKTPNIPPPFSAYNKAYGTFADERFQADFSTTVYYISLQTNLAGAPIYRRNVWIAGLPDAADSPATTNIIEPATQTAVTKFLNDLANVVTSNGGKNSVSIRSVDRSGANAVKPCTAWNLLADTYTVPAHGFVLGQPIIAEGMKTAVGGRCPRGRYLVGVVIDANTIALQGSSTPTAPTKLGGFRAAIITFNSVAVATGLGFSKRNKGRPSGLSVGRRRSPAIARA